MTGWLLDGFVDLTPAGEGWTADVPPGWTPAGSAHGGVLFGLGVAAMRRCSPHPNLLTSTAHFLRPTMPGPAEVRAELIRSGGAHASLSAQVSQGGKDTVRLVAAFGTMPEGEVDTELTPPVLPDPDRCTRIHGADDATTYPESLDVRVDPAIGWPHGRPTGRRDVTGWARMVDDRPHDDISLALFADAFPPSVFDSIPDVYVPTIELTVHIRGIPRGPWLRGQFSTRAVNTPYVEEDGVLWDGDGRLVAMSRQLAMIRPRA